MPAQDLSSDPQISSEWNDRSVDELATIDQVEAALDAACKLTSNVEEKLDKLLSQATVSASSRAATLGRISQTAVAVSDDASQLTAILGSSARTADALSARIRFLDSAFESGNTALTRVDNVLTLRVCAEGAKTSLSAGDLPSAASHVQKYLELDAEVREDPSSLAAVGQMNQSMAELARKIREKADLAAESFLDPASQNDGTVSQHGMAGLLSTGKLFVPIGLAEEGLGRITDCLKSAVAREADSDLRSLLMDGVGDAQTAEADQQQPHCVALARLFETVAAFVHDAENAVVESFGPPALVTLVVNLQEQCDTQSDKILVRYADARNLDQVSRAVTSETANARDLDLLLSELAILSQRTAAYFEFLRNRCLAALENGESSDGMNAAGSEVVSDDPQKPPPAEDGSRSSDSRSDLRKSQVSLPKEKLESCLLTCKLHVLVENIRHQYIAFEAYFMRENVRKAIRIDEHVGDNAKTSTAVDDFFFVLQKVVNRSLTYGGSVETLVAMMGHVNQCLSDDLLMHIRRRLREAEEAMDKSLGVSSTMSALPSAALTVSYLTEFAKANIPTSAAGVTATPGSGLKSESQAYDFFVALNNAAVSSEYAHRFRGHVEHVTAAQYPATLELTRALLVGPLEHINETARALASVSEQGVAHIAATMTGRISAATDQLLSRVSYVVSDPGYDSQLSSATFSQAFLDEVETKVLHSSVEDRMTETMWDSFVRNVAEWAANRVEDRVFGSVSTADRPGQAGSGKRFNALGGLKADRDVRSMSAYFAGKCRGSSVRDVFARLSQAAMLVNLEQPSEVYDIWGSNAGGMTWRLAPSEVRAVLKLRVDFDESSVAALRL